MQDENHYGVLGVAESASDEEIRNAFAALAKANNCPLALSAPDLDQLAELTATAKAAGAEELVGGQVDDLAAEFTDVNLAHLEEIHRRKTGAMFLVSLRLGGLVAEADDE